MSSAKRRYLPATLAPVQSACCSLCPRLKPRQDYSLKLEIFSELELYCPGMSRVQALIDAVEPTNRNQGVWFSGGVQAFRMREEPKACGPTPTNTLVGSLAKSMCGMSYPSELSRRFISPKALLCSFLKDGRLICISSATSRRVFSSK